MTEGAHPVNHSDPIARGARLRQDQNMRFSSLLPALLALSACAPLSIYHKPGVPVARWQADTTRCAAQAARDVPANTQIRQEPPTYVPSRRICDAAGNCRVTGGYFIPGRIYTEDRNAPLRARVRTECMAALGYAPVDIPRCPAGTQVSGPSTRLPPLGPASCFVPLSDGSFAIVEGNPA
jgi:hypothetical protein